jgi:hypothetical protein
MAMTGKTDMIITETGDNMRGDNKICIVENFLH